MESEFYDLSNLAELSDGSELVIPRARVLHAALRRERDYELVEIRRRKAGGAVTLEWLVIDVECDGVPPRNGPGIRYRERLALCISANEKVLVEVLALRRDFPTLIHQNQTPAGAPASLCLYFEPAAAVLRTWTPQKFLRRIQWWLEQSARGTLHPADQPVEQLFFATKNELVLPWNFDELRRGKQRLIVRRAVERPDGGETYFLFPAPETGPPMEGAVTSIEIGLPGVVHGRVERDATTLGELADALASRGADLLSPLRAEVEARVGEHGIAAAKDQLLTIIIVYFAVVREEGAEPERFVCRGFLLPIGPLQLGAMVDSLFLHDGTYFRAIGVLASRSSELWRSQAIYSMDVLRFNSAGAARAQSGLSDPGPEGVIVGAGALGGAILGLWGRSGWGRWTVIDNDHIKPHNLSRHVAYSQHIGVPKADVLVQLHAATVQGATEVRSLVADATDLTDSRVAVALSTAALVVDVSTTLEFPRLVSTRDGIARHISAFITPSGNAAVLLAEDRDRRVRLRTLEAQYYRAVMTSPWGARHLDRAPGSFWSGAGCRDISVVLPFSRIVEHAARLAEQAQLAANEGTALIRVWTSNPETAAVRMHKVSVYQERRMPLGDLDVFIDKGLERRLRALRKAHSPVETGGILLGYYDFNVNMLVVVDALPAPSDSLSSTAFFERGVKGVPAAIAEASRRTAGIVGYVGEWHSHPPGHSASLSSDDLIQLVYLTIGMADDGLPAISMIVGERDIRVFQGTFRE